MMKIEVKDLIKIAKNILTEMGIEDFSNVKLTYANKKGNDWLVSFSFREKGGWYDKPVSFAINATTGKTRGIWLDRTWK